MRSISDEEIAIIKSMIAKGIEKTVIQAYFTHPNRPVNFGRITNIEQGTYGPEIPAASSEDTERFLRKWNETRGASVETIAENALDIAELPPNHSKKIKSLFRKDRDGSWHVINGETDNIECKQSFSLGSKILRAIAALANNNGGYVLFGVDNRNVAVGLQNTRFQDCDPSTISQNVRSAMEPMPNVEAGECKLGSLSIGALYVHRAIDGPVISSKTDQEFREGTIYFRYPGESRAIRPAEFRRLLTDRDNRIRHESGERIAKLMDLGPRGAIVDLGSSNSESTKIVREAVEEADVLRNFVRQENVEFPLAYLLKSCSTTRSWLPIFYYARLSGLSLSEIADIVSKRETSYIARKRDLLARLRGEKTAFYRASGRIEGALRRIKSGDMSTPGNARDAADMASAIIGLTDDKLEIGAVLKLLRSIIETTRDDPAARVDMWSYIYKAGARIDELYFKLA